MALPYTKVNWQDGVTPENASTLGQMDQGIKDLDDAVQAILAGGTGGGVEYENAWAAGTDYQSGDVVNYGGVEYLAVNPSTGQAPPAPAAPPSSLLPVPLVTALPASPFDGQEVILTDSLTAPTYTWRFRYMAAKATNRWLFIGGAPLESHEDAVLAASWTANTWVSPYSSDPSPLTIPVTGLYQIEGGATVFPAAAATFYVGVKCGSTEPTVDGTGAAGAYSPIASGRSHLQPIALMAAGASDVVTLRYRSPSGQSYSRFGAYLRVTPQAVGG